MINDQFKQHVIQQVVEMQQNGYTFTQACITLGIPRSTAWDWINNRKRNSFVEDLPIEDESEIDSDISTGPTIFIRSKNIKQAEENFEDIKDFISNLAPINYPAPPKPKSYVTPNKYAMVIGDTHFGMENWKVLELFLETVSEIKPSMVILNGDTLDMFAISRYPKDIRFNRSLKYERDQYHKFLKMLHDVTEPFQAKIYETNANHSGDGSEGRWWRYLSESIGDIIELPEIKDYFSYQNIFFPNAEWNRTKLVDVVELCNSNSDNHFVIMHGDVVRRHGGYSARGVLEKWYTSAMINHTHRIGMTPQTFPSIGSKKEKIIRVYENGCACTLNPDYASAANWQNAFSIISYDDYGFSVETPVINNNRASICTLGKTLKV